MKPECLSISLLSKAVAAAIIAVSWSAPAVSAPGSVSDGVRSLPGAGSLNNQLQQEKNEPLLSPQQPALVLPADTSGQQARAPVDSGARVVIRSVTFTDMPSDVRVRETDLQTLLRPDLNRPLSFAGLQQMAEKITNYYRQHGFLLARAVLPPQTVRDGVLTVKIIPGRFDKSSFTSHSRLRDGMIQRMLDASTPPGKVISRSQLERLALLLNETPGVKAQVALQTGKIPGTAAVNATVTDDKRTGGYIGTDNLGSGTTGRGRLMGGFYAGELLRTGDQLQADALLSYEHADMLTGSVDYSSLINGYGTRAGVGYSRLDYQYTFQDLDFSGYSDNWNIYLSHPWLRTGNARVDARLEGGQQLLTDKYPAEFSVDTPRGRKTVNYISGGVNGSVASLPGGVTGLGLTFTTGRVDYRDDTARFWSGADIRGTTGQFARLNYRLQHEQQLTGPFSIYTSVSGQFANQNLDASQKLLLGGPASVRAYDVGDGAADNGTVATVEMRSRWALPAGYLPGTAPALTVSPFYDHGWGQQNRDNTSPVTGQRLAAQNHFSLAGAGVSVSLADSGNYSLSMTWARRTTSTDPVSGHKDRDRVWLSAVKTF
ncbi:ShlB/FhaC/HecB family hemolysin secretion/activation protein [Cronobacter sakazakii]|nr:ShlB/FhaC/HecB family hemolysin secretion/activation protein [Cronobacter sakazakii]HAY0261608.1 ShlB/FhaC/HecB family hemolysin secretion/activation protein [Escherichia coli]